LVRRKWTFQKARKPGRPPIDPQTAALILRMARENARWGCVRRRVQKPRRHAASWWYS